MKNKKASLPDIHSWFDIKDRVYGAKGEQRRDDLERESATFKIGLELKRQEKPKILLRKCSPK